MPDLSHSDTVFVPICLSAAECHAVEMAVGATAMTLGLSPEHPALLAAIKMGTARREAEAKAEGVTG